MAENAHNTCHRGGRLVGPRFEIPKPAFDFVWPEGDAFFGCNHLVDGEGRRVKSKVRGVARVYSAGDRTETVTGMQWVEDERMTDLGHFLPWTCGGHPQVKLPLKLDGEIIDGETDWAALTKGVVEGTRAKSRPEFANRHAVSWLLRIYHLLEHTTLSDQLALAVADFATGQSKVMRAAGWRFFAFLPGANGVDRLFDWVVEADPKDLKVTKPSVSKEPLAVLAQLAVAASLNMGKSEAAIEAARVLVLQKGKAAPRVADRLRKLDRAWWLRNAKHVTSIHSDIKL